MENQTPETQQEQQPMLITLADLDLLRQILDLAASRGAFKGPELSDVGAIYNKLNDFLNMAAAQIRAEQEQANPEQSASTDTPTQGE